jgi:hypothetical protein
MPLIDLPVTMAHQDLPADVQYFLREADRRIERFQATRCIPAFVPSEFAGSYEILRQLAGHWATPGTLFCEWGSGFGVVACLAAMLDFDSYGIEIEPELVEAAQQLADDFELPVRFIQGSLVPPGGRAHIGREDDFAWFTCQDDRALEEVGLEIADFAVIFSYPWPDEEKATEDLFESYAGLGAVLVTHHSGDHFRVRRKVMSPRAVATIAAAPEAATSDTKATRRRRCRTNR